MKLRSLPSLLIVTLLVGGMLLVNNYRKAKKDSSSNDINNQLTSENPPQKGLKALLDKSLKKQDEMTERSDFDDNLVVKERFYTESEISEMTETQFVLLLDATELKLPRISDLKKIPEGALHTTPAPVLEAGRELGLIKEILKTHNSYEQKALGFYEKCAKNSERPTPVRALCLTNLVEVKKRNNEKININEYPPQLVELTKMITDL